MTQYWIPQYLLSIVCIWLLTQQAETLLLTRCILSLPQSAFSHQIGAIPAHVTKKHKWALNQKLFETDIRSNQFTHRPNFRIFISKPSTKFEQVQQRAFMIIFKSAWPLPHLSSLKERREQRHNFFAKADDNPIHCTNISSSQANEQLVGN